MIDNQNEDFSKHYNDDSFWDKIKKFAKAMGKKLLLLALELYYCSKDNETAAGHILLIISSLGYLIFPFDLIPDALPGGYTDDLAVLVFTAKRVADSIKDEHKEQAQDKFNDWFGDEDQLSDDPESI
tara:strand:+ start:206 stop:586 length:381 start_codon:yes stop_codon:yes gene_type:complete